MVDDIENQPAPQTALTDAELRALAYFAVGVGSEGSIGGRDVSNRLAFAGTIRNGVMDPIGNSGYTIGTLQTDLGAHPEAAVQFVDAYQAWAMVNHPDWVLTDAQRTQTASDIGRNGRAIEAQNGRPVEATVKSHLDSFLASDAGITFVHDRDVAQIDTLMRLGGAMDQLRGTTLYQNSSLDDQAKLATVVLKLENQGGHGYYPRIISGINDGTIDSVEDAINLVDGFMPNRSGPNRNGPDYIESGMDHAQEGTEVFNSLRNADQRSPLHQPWQSVLANPLVNPTRTGQDVAHPNLNSEYTAIKDLFLQKGKAPALIEALDQGGAYGYNITNSRGQSRPQSTSLYASGNDFVVMDGNGIGKAYIGGAWSDVDRANLTRVNNRDGTVDLNINRTGSIERLLHVDPNAPVLRPAQQPTELAQPTPDLFDRVFDALISKDDALRALGNEYFQSPEGQQVLQEGRELGHAMERKADAMALAQGRPLPTGYSIGTLTGKQDPRDWDHPDHTLYSAIRQQLPREVSDDMAAHVMLQARRGGIHNVDRLADVAVHNGQAFVAGRNYEGITPVTLSQTPPSMEDTVQQSQRLDQQLAQERLQWLAQQQEQARNGPSMSL